MGISEIAIKIRDDITIATGVVVVRDLLTFSDADDDNAVTLDVKGYRQTDSFSCGFVAGLMALHTFYPKRSIDRFYKLVSPDRDWGTSTTRLLRALRSSGVAVTNQRNLNFDSLYDTVQAGYPLITTVKNGTADDEHWIMIYGVGKSPKRVFIAGNSIPVFGYLTRDHEMRWVDFKKIWAPNGFGLVCSGKGAR